MLYSIILYNMLRSGAWLILDFSIYSLFIRCNKKYSDLSI